jgi:precorrin-2 dehydrogenase / sirohydrochlorin ferrochelatase
MFLRLEGRHCVVVGAGRIAEHKIASLLRAGANVTVIAPAAGAIVAAFARAGRITWRARIFHAKDLRHAFLVVAATSSSPVNESVRRAATRFGVLCNVLDDPRRCDFYYPAVVRRGPLQIAISTSGESPALAQQIRRKLARQFSRRWADAVKLLGKRRRVSLRLERSPRRRVKLAHAIARATIDSLDRRARKQGANRA